ncbi:50S ribosomal protein L1 [Candidatus Daviesbacteria bacterium]|nr:50S ribosomal protein L1 [Candidatus Daviesbacteria bacterium]
MDDSIQQKEPKKPAKKLGRTDELVEKLKAELEGEDQSSVLSSQLSDKGKSVTSLSVSETDKQRTDKLTSENRKQKPDNRRPAKSKPRSKKYQQATKDLDRSKTYPLNEAVDLVKKHSFSAFTGTLEAHILTIQTGLRGLVSLPYASGKKLRILAYEGDDETIENISKGKIDFDLIVTTPAGMPKLAKVARILGPKGLMPNPKSGTIVTDLKKAVESFQAGKTEYKQSLNSSLRSEYKTEAKAPVIHLGLGKLNQPTEELSANIKTLLQTIGKSRIKKVSLSPTMGPSIKLDLASI